MDKLGIRSNCCFYLFEVCAVNYRGFDAPFFSPKLVENAVSGDICNGGEDNVVALFQLGEEKRGKRRNAARQNYAVLAALKISDLFLQQTLIYAAVAGVDLVLGSRPVHGRRVVGQQEAVSHVDSRLDSARAGIRLVADVDSAGGEAQPIVIVYFFFAHIFSSFRVFFAKFVINQIILYHTIPLCL